MANGTLYRGYPTLAQGVEAGREVITLIVGGIFVSDIKHSLAVCDTVGGAILGVYPGAPGVSTTQALSAELRQNADTTFRELKAKLNDLVSQAENPVAKATDEGAKGIGIAALSDWLPYIKILLELIEKWFARPATT